MLVAALFLIVLVCCLFIIVIISARVDSYSGVFRPSASSLDLLLITLLMILRVLKEVDLLEQFPRKQIWDDTPTS